MLVKKNLGDIVVPSKPGKYILEPEGGSQDDWMIVNVDGGDDNWPLSADIYSRSVPVEDIKGTWITSLDKVKKDSSVGIDETIPRGWIRKQIRDSNLFSSMLDNTLSNVTRNKEECIHLSFYDAVTKLGFKIDDGKCSFERVPSDDQMVEGWFMIKEIQRSLYVVNIGSPKEGVDFDRDKLLQIKTIMDQGLLMSSKSNTLAESLIKDTLAIINKKEVDL